QLEKVILEVIEVPGDGLPVKAGPRMADLVIQVAPGFHLKAGKLRNHLAVRFHYFGKNPVAEAVFGKELEQRCIAQVLFQVGSGVQVFAIDLRYQQSMTAEMTRELQKGDVFSMHFIQNPNGAQLLMSETDNCPPRAAQVALQRLHLLHRPVEMPLK